MIWAVAYLYGCGFVATFILAEEFTEPKSTFGSLVVAVLFPFFVPAGVISGIIRWWVFL